MAARKGTRKPPTLKLNLMPPYVKAAKKAAMALVATVIGGLVILAGMGVWWQRNAAAIGGFQQKLDELTPKAEEVEKMKQEAQNIEGGVKSLTDRLAVLDDVRQSGKQWTDMFQQVRMWIPEGVRLTAFIPQGTPTQANAVQLVGYTTSVRKLRDFYSYLSQADVFSNVTLVAWEWNGTIYPGTQLPAVLPKAPPLKGPPEAGAAPPSPGAPTAPSPGMPSPGAAPMAGPPLEEEAMGAPSLGGGAMMGGPSATSGPAGAPTMGGPAAAGEPMGALPMAGGAMRGMMPMMPGVGMGGMGGIGAGQVQIVRDPTAPRNVVYFVIMAQLSRPVQVAASLMAQPAAVAGVGGMPSGMMGGMPGGMMGGAMPGGMMGGPMMGGPGGMPSGGPAAPPTPAGGAAGGAGEEAGEEAGIGLRGGLGRRGAAAGLE